MSIQSGLAVGTHLHMQHDTKTTPVLWRFQSDLANFEE